MFSAATSPMALAVWAAWKNSRPILRLYHQYVQSSPPCGHFPGPSNELKTIETLLHEATENAFLSRKQLDKQLEIMNLQRAYLKQQMVMMLISGNESPVVSRQIQEMGYRLDHGMYAVLFIHLEEGGNTTDLLKDVEGFSDEEYTLYAAELQENREYIVLMNFQEEEQCRELLELLSDSLESRNLSVQVQLSRLCSQLDEIASAAIETLNTPPTALTLDSGAVEEEDALEQLAALTESGSTPQALALLETLIAQTENRYPSYLMRIYMLNRLAQQVMALASQEGVALPQEPIGQDPASMRAALEKLVRALCCKAEGKLPVDKPEGGKVAAYVREHCLDGDISLSSTAEAMGISTKQVSRLLRVEVDKTFKEYLLQLRMEAAQGFLREEGLSIAETANRVGYFNISHFIKCFKTYTGMTPGEWKKLSSGK